MEHLDLMKFLSIKSDSKIVLLVMDGVGDIPDKKGKTPLELANTTNLNELAKKSALGLTHPISRGVTPGSGPSHLALFGYNPLGFDIGRGVLEALGIEFKLSSSDIPARANFATIENGLITDRRAGRIPTEKNIELCKKLSGIIKEIDGVEIIIRPGKEHRFVVIFRGNNLNGPLLDADPQQVGLAPIEVKPVKEDGKFAAEIANKFIKKVTEVLKDELPANTCLLRGMTKIPEIPSMTEAFKLNPAAIATYPMYRGLARLVGMSILKTGDTVESEFETLKENWDKFDFFYLHVKKTDSYGEDGNKDGKIHVIEETDALIPKLIDLKPDVIAITSDHSTPWSLKAHSWHPNPFLLFSENERSGYSSAFTEKECATGALGQFYSEDALPLMLASALKLKKFGA
ncbi:2,3-bisphosphoglycerate-independent phosphoglycerate mutase [Candidatus Dependentiae bacterium]|nr:2,3-bisphosphoglycerate-independent phosphoglycerate mutase [Candidatus Dependentiae bacterium]